MTCTQCGSQVAPGNAHCTQCGAPVAAPPSGGIPQPPPMGAPQPPPPMGVPQPPPMGGMPQPGPMATAPGGQAASAMQGFSFDFNRLSQADKITGIASLVLLISLFLPWFSISAEGFSVSWNGVEGNGALWLTFLLCLGIAGFLVVSAGFERLPFQLPISRELILLIATGVNLLLVLIGFFTGSSFSVYIGQGVGWSFGAIIALLAALGACAPVAVPAIQSLSKSS